MSEEVTVTLIAFLIMGGLGISTGIAFFATQVMDKMQSKREKIIDKYAESIREESRILMSVMQIFATSDNIQEVNKLAQKAIDLYYGEEQNKDKSLTSYTIGSSIKSE